MLKLKDEIEKIIETVYRESETTALSDFISELAQKIADSLEIDEGKLNKILQKEMSETEGAYGFRVAKAIARARPIRIKVEW